MRGRALLAVTAALGLVAGACAKQVGDGGACFQSTECTGGSFCAATVYGNFCMKRCSPDVVFCGNGEACLRSSEIEVGVGGAGGDGGTGGTAGDGGTGGTAGDGGTGGEVGVGGMSGAGGDGGIGGAAGDGGVGGAAGDGGMGGAAGDGGMGGAGGDGGTGGSVGGGGVGGSSGDEVWACLPGGEFLATNAFISRDVGEVCDYSVECERGLVCVCIPGAICEDGAEGKNGPTCQRLCDPTEINQCPRINDIQPVCTNLGDGRGFCDPTTLL